MSSNDVMIPSYSIPPSMVADVISFIKYSNTRHLTNICFRPKKSWIKLRKVALKNKNILLDTSS